MKKYCVSITISCLINLFWINPASAFESSEHIAFGNQVKLQFEPGMEPVANKVFTFPNELSLSYGEIVALAGDFYGLPDSAIALGATDQERRERFLAAYATLTSDSQATEEAPKILAVIHDEEKQLQAGIAKGENSADIYARMGLEHDAEWSCITGGSCARDYPMLTKEQFLLIYYGKPGRYLKLADHYFDHFGQDAFIAYTVGHRIALEKAIKAHDDNQPEGLADAYAMNAFANHYLSDGFSSGHMRTPLSALDIKASPTAFGSFLSGYMHQEDCRLGLIVSNARGNTWKAYGDAYYLDPRNQASRDLLNSAMQASADEIYTAYLSGRLPATDSVLLLIPDLKKLTANDNNRSNTSPMFYWDEANKTLMRRTNLKDPTVYAWTAEWSVMDTLKELMM